jgi:GTPase SAR1 family protein
MYGWADGVISYNLTSDECIVVDSGWRSYQVQDNLPGRPISGQIVDHREVHQRPVRVGPERKCFLMQPTVGIDFHIKNVTRNGRQFRIQLWDTAGQERFRSLIPNYMKDANCAVMVYDITKRSSLENLRVWNEMFEQHQTPDAIKVFVGNKIDLSDREVAKKDG